MDASSLPGPLSPGRPAHLLLCWRWESQCEKSDCFFHLSVNYFSSPKFQPFFVKIVGTEWDEGNVGYKTILILPNLSNFTELKFIIIFKKCKQKHAKQFWTCLLVLQEAFYFICQKYGMLYFFQNVNLPFFFVFSIFIHFKPSTENYCFASRAKSCSVCLQSGKGCAYCPDEVRRKMAPWSKRRPVLREPFFL